MFYTPHYHQANRIVERTNGLLKCFLKPRDPGWSVQLSEAMTKINNSWGVNRCPRITAFYSKSPSILPGVKETKNLINLLHYPGQPVLVELPNVEQVPLVPNTPFQ